MWERREARVRGHKFDRTFSLLGHNLFKAFLQIEPSIQSQMQRPLVDFYHPNSKGYKDTFGQREQVCYLYFLQSQKFKTKF